MEQSFRFPLSLHFKIGTLANDFIATDADGHTVAYVREKILKLVDKIDLYSDESKQSLRYKIEADRWLDFNANYSFLTADDKRLGSIGRKGWRSLWSARYDVYDENRQPIYIIKEENPWIKILDSLLGEIPILSFLVGYFFNPKYQVLTLGGDLVARLIKQPSFWGRKFSIETYQDLNHALSVLVFLGCTEVALLERRRG